MVARMGHPHVQTVNQWPYFTPIVTENELFAGLVSVPTKVADPVVVIVPVVLNPTFAVTTIVCPPARLDRLQETFPPAVPGAGPVHDPRLEETDWNTIPGANVVLKLTPLATTFWLSLICQVKVSVPVEDGPPFCADPTT